MDSCEWLEWLRAELIGLVAKEELGCRLQWGDELRRLLWQVERQEIEMRRDLETDVTARDVIELLLQMDDQVIAPRPTLALRAANLVQKMALRISSETDVALMNCSLLRRRGDRTGW